MKKTNHIPEQTDEQLLHDFFAAHRQTLPADGFTERVLAALPQQQPQALRLRRWNWLLNGIACVAVLVMLFAGDFFGWLRGAMMSITERMLAGVIAFDWDTLLVQTMLFLHRLPQLLPSAQQLLALALVTLILVPLGLQKLAKSA